MNLKKTVSLVLVLTLTLSLLPAFSLTAFAVKGSELSMSGWAQYTDVVFDYSDHVPDEVATEPIEEDSTLPISVSEAYGDGWSAAWSGTDDPGDQTYINANINTVNANLQIYGQTGTTDTLVMPDYGKDQSFVMLEFYLTRPIGANNADFLHDFKLMDIDGKAIEIGSIGRDAGLQSGAYGNEEHSYYLAAPGVVEAEDVEIATEEAATEEAVAFAATYIPEAVKVHTGYDSGVRMVMFNNSDGTYTVTYYIAQGGNQNNEITEESFLSNYHNTWNDNSWKAAHSVTYKGQFDGLSGISFTVRGNGTDGDQKTHINYLRIYSGRIPGKDIEINYTVNGEAVKTIHKSYDLDGGEAGAIYEDFYYSPNGTNAIYYAPEATYSDSQEVELTLLPKNEGLPMGTYFEKNGVAYKVIGENIISNGDFAYGLNGWYSGTTAQATTDAFTVNSDATITANFHHPHNEAGALFRTWEIRKDVQYVFSFTSSVNNPFAKVSLTNAVRETIPPRFAETPDGEQLIAGWASYDGETAGSEITTAGRNTMVFTSTAYDYLQIMFRWLGKHNDKEWAVNTFGNFSIQQVEEVPLIDAFSVPDIEVISGNKPILPQRVNVTYQSEYHGSLYDTIPVEEWYTEDVDFTVDDMPETITVNGSAGGKSISVNVVVYPQLFALKDLSSNKVRSNGNLSRVSHLLFTQDNTTEGTAQSVSGVVKFEFDLDWNYFAGGHVIGFSNKSAMGNNIYGGSQQIQFGAETAIGAEGYETTFMGKPFDENAYAPIHTGKFRVFVKSNTLKHTYNIRLTNPDGSFSADFTNLTYRRAADILDTFILTENYDGTGESYLKSTNLRVSASNEITINYINSATNELIYSEIKDVPFGYPVLDDIKKGARFYLSTGSIAYILEAADAYSFAKVLCDGSDTLSYDIYVNVITDKAVMQDTYACSNTSDYSNENNMIFTAAVVTNCAAQADADNTTTSDGLASYMGSARVGLLNFNVPEYDENNKAVLLHAYVADCHAQIADTFKVAVIPTETDSFDEMSTAYKASDYVYDNAKAIWCYDYLSKGEMYNDPNCTIGSYITFDVSDAVNAARNSGKETITFAFYVPNGAIYMTNRERTVLGGDYQGLAAYLETTPGYSITVTGADAITKSGSYAHPDAEDTFILPQGKAFIPYQDNLDGNGAAYSDPYVAFTDSTKVYALNSGKTSPITPESDNAYYPAVFGLTMIDGAQVRIGEGLNDDGTVAGGSGLRFITTVNGSDSLATIEGATFGVRITAEAGTSHVDVPMEKWQKENEVFTTVLTNLVVSNYNRNFTATPYVVVDNQTFVGSDITAENETTRSIYKVASGLLRNGYTNEDNGTNSDTTNTTDYENVPTVLINVLNSYVNHTGIRLTLSDSTEAATLTARTSGNGAYTGDAFFTVSDTTYSEGCYTVTLTTIGDAVIDVDLFNKYLRINNNNSKVASHATITDNGDKTYIIVFDYGSMSK